MGITTSCKSPVTLVAALMALFFVLLLGSCKPKPVHIERAMYYWKNDRSSLSGKEDSTLSTLGIGKLYVKFFEVQVHPTMGNVPMAKTNLYIPYYRNEKFEVIPVVFISNEVMKSVEGGAIDTLADNIIYLVNKYASSSYLGSSENALKEIQIDCDWTPTTRANYFRLLTKIKTMTKAKISCTLRLYPYAYPDKMGIPPVDKVMLMCYNLLPPLKSRTKNSILDLEELTAYLKGAKRYPLHTDIALPVFSWMHLYRNNQFLTLINKNPEPYKALLNQPDALWSEVISDALIDQVYLRTGDQMKTEQIQVALLKKAVQTIKKHVPLNGTTTVSLFHLDEDQLNQYSYEELDYLYSGFHR
jgi:hypothetical protein